MRRLPVYFLIDVSESMVGEPIAAVENGIREIIRELMSDPYALETVYVAVLAFAGRAEVAEKLTEITAFRPPALPIGSGTSLGAGLELLMRDIDSEVQKTTRDKKGDWKPLVFLFTDGAPTDNPSKSIEKWNRNYRGHANLVAVAFGDNADTRLLGTLTENVLRLGDMQKNTFREFFKWVSASIQVSSMAIADSGDDSPKLDRMPSINLEKVDTGKACKIDENFVILVNRCSQKGTMYLSKFARENDAYVGAGAWLVDEKEYKRLGGGEGGAAQIDTGRLSDLPECPVCGNTGLVHCGECGGLSCMSEGQTYLKCPWCGNESGINYRDNFSIDRARG